MKWRLKHHLITGITVWLVLAIIWSLNQFGARRFCGMDGPVLEIQSIGLRIFDWSQLWFQARTDWSAVVLLLLLVPAVFAPLSWQFGADCGRQHKSPIHSLAVVLLLTSLLTHMPTLKPYFGLAAWFAVPWFLMQLRQALLVTTRWFIQGISGVSEACLDTAGVFPCIGATWLLAHQANWTPWNFDPLIVLLTAAHFHHAGFTLPLMAGLNAKASPGCWTRFSCVAIWAGVPLVAAGITCTHFGVLRFVEPFGVTVLVLGALGVAVSQLLRGIEFRSGLSAWTRAGFVISGGSLLVAMLLAMGFGLRHVIPNWALTMPQMWMIHGTLNAFGFGLCGILAWRSKTAAI